LVLYFRNVNIYGEPNLPAVLLFYELDSPSNGSNTHFWASSIIIENFGELNAYGRDVQGNETYPQPFGYRKGVLTIHLYGKNEALNNTGEFGQNQGAVCKTVDLTGSLGPCGIPKDIWESKGAKPEVLPGLDANGVQIRDYFYQYEPLHADGRCTDLNGRARVGVVGQKRLCEDHRAGWIFWKQGARRFLRGHASP
jgi:hypothetical protein